MAANFPSVSHWRRTVVDSETADLDFLKNLTILYVEDEDDAFNHSLELLSRFCNSVVTARNGEEGLAAYAFNQPDIVITDIRMPKVDGLEMAAGIRAQNSSVSIIVMTAFEQANYLKRSIDIGIDAYVSKPLNFKQFYRSLLSSAHRLRVERQLLESTELFSKLTEQAPGMVFQYRLFPDGRHFFPYASKAINSLFGLKPEEVRSDASAAFARVHPDDLNNLLEATIESARQLKVCVSEFRVLHPEQGERWLSSNARPERLADGSTVWHGFMSDITVTKELYRALEAQEQFTSSTINGLNAHICVIDANGSIMRTNKAWNDFAAENGAPAESCGVGANYLETCLKSCASDEPDIRYFVDAIRSVTSGAAAAFCMEYLTNVRTSVTRMCQDIGYL